MKRFTLLLIALVALFSTCGQRGSGQFDIYTTIARACALAKTQAATVTVNIRAGTYLLDRPLFIPGGTTGLVVNAYNVTLKHRPGIAWAGPLIVAGDTVRSDFSDNDSLYDYANRIGANAYADRDSATITLDSASNSPPGYWVLTDDTKSIGTQGDFDVRRELVYGGTDGESTTFTLSRQPARYVGSGSGSGHTYSANAELISVDARASRNITINGLTLDGSNVSGGYANYLSNFKYVDGLTFYGVTAKKFFLEGLTTAFCRSVTYSVCTFDDSNADSGGEGYAIADYGVYNTRSLNCTFTGDGGSEGIRHCHYTAYGVSNKYQYNTLADDTIDDVGTPIFEIGAHVGADVDCKAENLTATGTAKGVSFGGHQLFGYGSTGTVATNIDANGGDGIVALDTTTTATDVTGIRRLTFIGCSDRTVGTPPAGVTPSSATGPGNCTFTRVEAQYVITSASFDNNAGAAATYGAHQLTGTVTFVDCTFVQDVDDAPTVDMRSDSNCTITISGGTYQNDTGTVYRILDIGKTSGGTVTLNVTGAIFTHNSGGGTREAFRLNGSGTVGTVSGNSFNLSPGVNFMLDSGTWENEVEDPDGVLVAFVRERFSLR